MKKIIIIGGRGNGTVVLSTLEAINKVKKEWNILGFLNDKEVADIGGYPILGKVDRETVGNFLKDDNMYFFYTLISVKLNFKYLSKLHDLKIPLNRFATLIHPTAVISHRVSVGYGTCISALACINEFSEIGNFVQIWPQVYLGTGVKMADYSYAAGQAYIGSYVNVEEGGYIGPSSSILEFKKLGRWSLVGMGSVVVKDVEPFNKVVGNPMRTLGQVE
jgi:acetyltransferase EpsM